MADWFEPGFKAGGPIRSCVNFAGNLKNDLEIFVLTTDRDLGDAEPYDGIPANKWIDYDSKVKVFYASPDWLSYKNIKKTIREIQPEAIYLNSMYSRFFSLYPLLMNPKSKMVLAPRGMLKESAVRFKSNKKKLFLRLFRVLGLHKRVHFHCTDATEVNDVKKYFGNVSYTLLGNNPGVQRGLQLPTGKTPGSLKLIFIGRMHPIKNLHFLLELLRTVKQQVQLTVIAGLEDKGYWQQCQQLIKQLPANIKVNYLGELPHHELEQQLLTHHVFVLPTKGENFGHAIFEALAAGRPALISDQTPWRNLEQQKAGWDIPLDQPAKFAAIIEQAAAMSNEELNQWCTGAWNVCRQYLEKPGIKEQYIKLFS